MATINAIRKLAGGQEILSNLVNVTTDANGKKVYTVTFPGAVLAAEGLKTDTRIWYQDKIYITGTYTFTEEEFQNIAKQAGSRYSKGDGDIILLEAAFEKYRQEVADTLKANPVASNDYGEAGLYTGKDSSNILCGGFAADALFILTGKQSKVYCHPNPIYGLDEDALRHGKISVVSTDLLSKMKGLAAAVPCVKEETRERSKLRQMLKGYKKETDNNGKHKKVALASFMIVDANGNKGYHVFTVSDVTDNSVKLVNPWDPDKELEMSIDDFVWACEEFVTAKIEQNSKNNEWFGSESIKPTEPTKPETKPSSQEIKPNTEYTVPKGLDYAELIKTALENQGCKLTDKNIEKAMAEFEKANPNSVKVSSKNGKKYLLAGDKVLIPKFSFGIYSWF